MLLRQLKAEVSPPIELQVWKQFSVRGKIKVARAGEMGRGGRPSEGSHLKHIYMQMDENPKDRRRSFALRLAVAR